VGLKEVKAIEGVKENKVPLDLKEIKAFKEKRVLKGVKDYKGFRENEVPLDFKEIEGLKAQ
jgi:hypothetical protein